MENVLRVYKDLNLKRENVAILFDDTVFGSAKEGFVITLEGYPHSIHALQLIYDQNILEKPAK